MNTAASKDWVGRPIWCGPAIWLTATVIEASFDLGGERGMRDARMSFIGNAIK